MFLVNHLIGFGVGGSSAPYTETTPNTTVNGNGNTGFTILDRSWAIDNDSTINSVGVYSSSGGSITIKIFNEDSSSQYDVVVSQAATHGGGGWQDFTLSSPYLVGSSGTYRVGLYMATQPIDFNSSGARSYKSGDITGDNQAGFTADTGNTHITRVTGTKPA